jgi:hypothetical protein
VIAGRHVNRVLLEWLGRCLERDRRTSAISDLSDMTRLQRSTHVEILCTDSQNSGSDDSRGNFCVVAFVQTVGREAFSVDLWGISFFIARWRPLADEVIGSHA